MREINQRPGACVCVARWDGEIVYHNPGRFYADTRGDKKSRGAKRPTGTTRRPEDGNRGRNEDQRRVGAHP